MSRINYNPSNEYERHHLQDKGVHAGLVGGFLGALNVIVLKANEFDIKLNSPVEVATTVAGGVLALGALAGVYRSIRAGAGIHRYNNAQQSDIAPAFDASPSLVSDNA